MDFQVVQQFEDPVWVNCNFTHWSEGACQLTYIGVYVGKKSVRNSIPVFRRETSLIREETPVINQSSAFYFIPEVSCGLSHFARVQQSLPLCVAIISKMSKVLAFSIVN